LQCSVFRSSGVGSQLVEGATDKTKVYSADDVRLLMGRLKQGTTMQLDDGYAGIGTWREAKAIHQGDNLTADRHGAARLCGNRDVIIDTCV
jgi:hypothetical protein